jgi:hypothetical protein
MTTPPTFTLTINGQVQTYARDKEGKRQAILDGLRAIPLLTVGDNSYLPHDAALQVVAAVLYPDGIESTEAYHLVCQVTDRACGHLGFGAEVQLEPPQVAFDQRGSYRPQLPPLDETLVVEMLDQVGTSSRGPYQQIGQTIVWQKAAWQRYDKHLSTLTAAERSAIESQVDEIAQAHGWLVEDESYIRPLPADLEKARLGLTRYLSGMDGRPLPPAELMRQATTGAYGRVFYKLEKMAPALHNLITTTLTEYGYQSEARDGFYYPLSLPVADDTWDELPTHLQTLTPVETIHGPGLLLTDVEAAVKQLTGLATISDWQLENLIAAGPVGQVLVRLGYRASLTWCQAYQFQPRLETSGDYGVLLKEVRISRDLNKKIGLAAGLSVYTPALALGGKEGTLVYLEMVGAKQAVRANWAALMGKGQSHWIDNHRIALDGMKAHVKLQSCLPCGWHHLILIHKQASLKEMNPEQPFYLLDDGRQPIPPLFYPMLNKALALPLLPDWSDYLWQNGRQRKLITLLDDGKGQGYAAWRVKPAPTVWQEVLQGGLQEKAIVF